MSYFIGNHTFYRISWLHMSPKFKFEDAKKLENFQSFVGIITKRNCRNFFLWCPVIDGTYLRFGYKGGPTEEKLGIDIFLIFKIQGTNSFQKNSNRN